MQKIYFKKMIDLNHQLKELLTISVDESINYKMENQGMRAFGSIVINGDYKDGASLHQFQETIDIDILAQYTKIEDKNEFHIKVEDFDYSFVNGDLSLVIQACIYGVKDDEDRVVETDMVIQEEEEDLSEEIESLLRDQEEQEVSTQQPIIMEKQMKPMIDQQPVVEDIQTEEEDDEDIGIYYLYVVQEGDTYQSVASRYQVDEYMIKEYNHDRPLSKGTIVIIPYYS